MRLALAEPHHHHLNIFRLQFLYPLEQFSVIVPKGCIGKNPFGREAVSFFKGFSLHFHIGSGIGLSCGDADVAKKIANHHTRIASLQKVHSLCVAQNMRANQIIQTRHLSTDL